MKQVMKGLTSLARLARLRKRTQREENERAAQESTELARKKKENEAADYAQYLRESGKESPDGAYLEALRKAEQAHALGAAEYGKSGEALRETGLLGSGYAAYLTAENARRRSEAERNAESKRLSEQLKLEGGYANYLAAHTKEQESRMNSAVKTILSENFESPEDAYRYALSIGLTDDRAKTVRDMSRAHGSDGYRSASLSARLSMLDYITRARMSYEEAYRYALALGAPEETAEQIARYAEASGEGVRELTNGF